MHLAETPDGSHAVAGHRPPPPGAPTVLLYCHYDVRPPLDDSAWTTPPFTLTERDGRWYGRGTADCKGNIVMHLTALRGLGEDIPVGLKFVAEGAEEQGTGGLEAYVAQHPELFLADALLVCDTGNAEVGTGTATVTVLGIDCPPVVGSAAVPPTARARVSLRVPPGTDADAARRALTDHLTDAAPWGARVTVETEGTGAPFQAATDGPAYTALGRAMERVYGKPLAFLGQGGSIPLCNVLAKTCPRAEIILMGVEEPRCLIHAPTESVDPTEIEHMANVEALFLREYAEQGAAGRGR